MFINGSDGVGKEVVRGGNPDDSIGSRLHPSKAAYSCTRFLCYQGILRNNNS